MTDVSTLLTPKLPEMTKDHSGPSQVDELFGALPFEIKSKIFSYLEDTDCLTAMEVCRSWYLAVPQYSHDVWTDVYITRQHILSSNKRWEKCIGNHVKSARFQDFSNETELYHAMQKLIDCGCNQLESFEFENCTTSTQATLLTLLHRSASSAIRSLTFTGHTSDANFIHLLYAHPKLRYFTYLQADHSHPFYMDVPVADLSLKFTNLIYLYVSVKSNAHHQLTATLQKCPNLVYLTCVSKGSGRYHRQDYSSVFQANQLSLWCPKLQYLELNCDTLHGFSNIDDTSTDSCEPGLRYFSAVQTSYVGSDLIGEYLIQNQSSLRLITLIGFNRESNKNSRVFKRLQCPKLRTLQCRLLAYDGDAMDTMLQRCPAIEILVLAGSKRIHVNLLTLLDSLPELKYLRLENVELDCTPSSGTTQQFGRSSKLQRLYLKSVNGITAVLLLGLYRLHALKHLVLDLYENELDYIDDSLCQFIKRLDVAPIDTLHIGGLPSLPSTIIRLLAGLPLLEQLALFGRQYITLDAPALIYLLHNSKTLKVVTIIGLELTGTDDDVSTFFKKQVHGYQVIDISKVNDHCTVLLQRMDSY